MIQSNRVISVIIPVYNEARTIINVIEDVRYLDYERLGYSCEIIVVNDGSTDDTGAVLASCAMSSIKVIDRSINKGKGYSIREGLAAASGDVIVIKDADREQKAEDIMRMLEYYTNGRVDVVFGSRFINSTRHATRLGYYGNRAFNVALGLLYGKMLTDMWTGYKMASKEVWRSMQLKSDRFDIEPEIVGRMLLLGVVIHEIPISFDPRTIAEGKHIRYSDGLRALRVLVMTRMRLY